jgi:signal transduction histidine kinase/streptogramin lyase
LKGEAINVSALFTDRAGDLWVGTANNGLYRVHAGQADHFGSADGLSSDAVQSFFEDHEGNLWVATSRGIDRFHDMPVVTYSIHEGLTSEDVDSVLVSRDGNVWVGNMQALDVVHAGRLREIARRNGLPGNVITSLLEARDGRLWVGVDSGLTVYDHGHFRWVNRANGKPVGVMVSLAEDPDGSIWGASTQPSLVHIRNDAVEEEIVPPLVPRVSSIASDPKEGIWLGLWSGALARYRHGQLETLTPSNNSSIRNLLVESDGSAWGATREGLLGWKEGKMEVLDAHNGLPCDDIFASARDNHGSLWLDTQCGFIMIQARELERWWLEPDAKVRVKALDVFDGAQPGLTNFRPEISKAPDGKLWLANENILQVVDPDHIEGNRIPPPVVVEQIMADRKRYIPGDHLQLPARSRDIEIDYTALSLVVPEKVRFRYKLDGHDREWQDPENRRRAFYSDLSPGNYQFHVIAANNDGVWNEQGATLGFTVLPAFFQTAWFRIGAMVMALGLLCLIYGLRVRQLAGNIQARFNERLEERERIARDLHDTLLQGIFSASIHFDVADKRLPTDSPAKSSLKRGIELLGQVSKEGRNTLLALRPPSSTGSDLPEALSRLRNELALPTETTFRVITEGDPTPLRPLIRDEVYLISREAVFNASRHSNASSVEVEIDFGTRNLRVLVRDSGCGIDPALLKSGREGHWGLANMRERAERIGGTLEIFSRINSGTVVQLLVPGRLAYELSSSKSSWTWLFSLFAAKPEKTAEKSGKG